MTKSKSVLCLGTLLFVCSMPTFGDLCLQSIQFEVGISTIPFLNKPVQCASGKYKGYYSLQVYDPKSCAVSTPLPAFCKRAMTVFNDGAQNICMAGSVLCSVKPSDQGLCSGTVINNATVLWDLSKPITSTLHCTDSQFH